MIWGVGTGRCGTRSLATYLKGEHEPKPWLKQEAAHYHRGLDPDGEYERFLVGQLTERAAHDTPIIVDLKNSYVMDLIERVDPDAHFIALFRNPFDCIASFMQGGAFTDRDWNGDRKLQPKDGWGEETTRVRKVAYHWFETNHTIVEHLKNTGRPWAVRFTHQLPVRENVYPKRNTVFGRTTAVRLFDYTWRLWQEINDLYVEQKDGWLWTKGITL